MNIPDIQEILGLEGFTVILPALFYGSNVIDITRNRQVIQVYSPFVRSYDLKIASQNTNLHTTMIIDDPTTNYYRSVADIYIPMITRFDWLMFLFRDMEGNITLLRANSNSSRPLRTKLKVKVKASQLSCRPISSVWLKCSVILRRRNRSWTILSLIRSVFHLVCVTLYRLCVAQRPNRPNGSDQCLQHTTGSVNTPRCLRHRNNRRNVKCEWCLASSNWCIVARKLFISR